FADVLGPGGVALGALVGGQGLVAFLLVELVLLGADEVSAAGPQHAADQCPQPPVLFRDRRPGQRAPDAADDGPLLLGFARQVFAPGKGGESERGNQRRRNQRVLTHGDAPSGSGRATGRNGEWEANDVPGFSRTAGQSVIVSWRAKLAEA